MSADRFVEPHQPFPETRWSLVARAGSPDATVNRAALEELLHKYLPALRAHLIVQKRVKPDRADDLVQGFISSKVVEQNLLRRADRERGKFRTFVLTALDRFIIDEIRKQQARRRAPAEGGVISLGDDPDLASVSHQPVAAFDLEWARQVLGETIARMKEECRVSGRPELWGVFECRILLPSLDGTEPTGYEELIGRFGFKSPVQASNMLITGKRMFARILRQVVGEYSTDADEADEEIRDLQSILAHAGAAGSSG